MMMMGRPGVYLGQFSANTWTGGGVSHTEPGYLDDKTGQFSIEGS